MKTSPKCRKFIPKLIPGKNFAEAFVLRAILVVVKNKGANRRI